MGTEGLVHKELCSKKGKIKVNEDQQNDQEEQVKDEQVEYPVGEGRAEDKASAQIEQV